MDTKLRNTAARFAGLVCILAACTSTSSSGPIGAPDAGPDAGASTRDAGRAFDARADVVDAGVDVTTDAGTDAEPDVADDAATEADADADAAVDADADADATIEEDAATRCNALEQRGEDVWMARQVGSRSPMDFDGGPIADGTYELIDAVHYAEQGETGQLTPIGRETIRVVGGVLDEVQDFPAGDTRRFTASLVVTGTRLTMTTTCVWASIPGTRFPELGDWAPLEHETTAFDATTARVVVWTPRGNHESVVRTYAKVD